jgi:hypothetical protein
MRICGVAGQIGLKGVIRDPQLHSGLQSLARSHFMDSRHLNEIFFDTL